MCAPLSLQHLQVHHIFSQVQRQKTVFADNLLFSLVVAAGCLRPADKLEGLMSPSEHAFPFCYCSVGWLSWGCLGLVGRVRGQKLSR